MKLMKGITMKNVNLINNYEDQSKRKLIIPHQYKSKSINEPWSIDRMGRFIMGIGLLVFSFCVIFISQHFVIIFLLSGLNLIITSFSNKCLFNKFLKTIGFKEREEIYEPGGIVKKNK